MAPDGTRQVLTRTVVALPATQLAQEAEAWGCRAGLELLLAAPVEVGRRRVVGDSLSVVRSGAGRARV